MRLARLMLIMSLKHKLLDGYVIYYYNGIITLHTLQFIVRTSLTGYVLQIYVLSKLVSEEEALKYAKERGMDLVSVITTTVSGPFLTPFVPSSVQVLLSPITGVYI